MGFSQSFVEFLYSFRLLYSTGLAEKYDRVLIPGFRFLHQSDGNGPEHMTPEEAELAPNWLNLGYWKPETRTLAEASENLAVKLGDMAEFKPGLSVLDAGCGLGDLVLFWHDHYSDCEPLRLTGLNISPSQVARARQRIKRTRHEGAVSFVAGDAMSVKDLGERFDRITALECAFHFESRAGFFASAFEGLKPGGRIAIVDVGLRDGTAKDQEHFFIPKYLGYRKENLGSIEDCRSELEEAGFVNIQTQSIAAEVYQPFLAYARSKIGAEGEREYFQKVASTPREARLLAAAWRSYLRVTCLLFGTGEYFVAAGEKPS